MYKASAVSAQPRATIRVSMMARSIHTPSATTRGSYTIKQAQNILTARTIRDASAPIQNKVGAFLTDPGLNRIVTGSKQELRVRQLMDEGKVLLVNLAKGQIGEDSSSLLGGLLVTTIGLAAFSRAEVSPEQRRDFFVYCDRYFCSKRKHATTRILGRNSVPSLTA
jgi:hypothetical protein